jgi:23S rRNA (guanosine2251-2'-O)-methyltransferase
MIVILDNIRSLHNVGSIFRTSDGAGAEKIYLCGITPTPVDDFGYKRPQLSKVSLGSEDSVSWEYKKHISRLIKTLKKQGYLIVALEQAKNSLNYNQLKLPQQKLALVLGNEPTGISQKVLDLADYIIEIPMLGEKESLNVSVAFGIAIYRLLES